jgi:hypothetical protein
MSHLGVFSRAAVALACAAALPAFAADTRGYAENIYAEYAGNQGVSFAVETIRSGSLSDIAPLSMEQLVGPATYLVEGDDKATSVENVRVAPLDANKVNTEAFSARVSGFEDVGLPLDKGSYRLLQITVEADKQLARHQAAEFCWSSLNHCVVFDPNIEFIDSVVNGHRELKAQGYAPRAGFEPVDKSKAVMGCALASDTRYIAKWWTWGAYKRTYKNVYGITMVTKNMGGQQAGIRCNTSCYPAPFGYSHSSSAFANVPFSVQCDNAFGAGTTGRRGKFDAESKCAHRLAFSAKAEASVASRGSVAVDIKWDTTGSIDGNGGQMIDTCGYF